MTTLVALNTMDAVVMGCDSLGTVSADMVNPYELGREYFDPNNFELKLGPDGKPLLHNFRQLYVKRRSVPTSHMSHVEKLFPLNPLDLGVMFAGAVFIGNRTVKSLLEEFKSEDKVFTGNPTNYTLRSVSERLLKFIWEHYVKEYPEVWQRPQLELMVGGYDKQRQTPGVVQIDVQENTVKSVDYDFRLYTTGQTNEIDRLVFGADIPNYLKLKKRAHDLLTEYCEFLTSFLRKNNIPIDLPKPDEFRNPLNFPSWNDLDGLKADWAAFSLQNAIDCVDFLVSLMINSQQFSTTMPTVAGDVQIAVIQKARCCKFVSKRELRHRDHAVPLDERPTLSRTRPSRRPLGHVG